MYIPMIHHYKALMRPKYLGDFVPESCRLVQGSDEAPGKNPL